MGRSREGVCGHRQRAPQPGKAGKRGLGSGLQRLHRQGADDQKGITGLETAIILIAFVVVASVFAFTVLSTGVFSSEKSKEAMFAGLQQTRSTMVARGSTVAFKGKVGSTGTVYKVSFVVSNAVAGEPIDLTPPYTKDDSNTDPDVSAGAEYVTTVTYSDKYQSLPDVPWSIGWLGNSSNDNLLEMDEKAEIVVWLLKRNTGTAIGDDDSVAYMTTEGGITSSGTVPGENESFTIEVKPPSGGVLTIERTLPAKLDTVMDLH